MACFTPFYSPLRLLHGLLHLQNSKLLTLLFSFSLTFFSYHQAQAQCDITLTPTNIRSATCGGKEGSFSVEVTGITAPYQYSLQKEINGTFVVQENGTLIAGTPTFVGLTGGTYKFEVNKNGCVANTTVVIQEATLTLTPTNLHQPTCGGKDGSFQVQAEGIVAPYQYALYKEVNGVFEKQENGTLIAGTLTFVGLTGGTYRVDVTKGGTCSGSVTVLLDQAPLTLTPTNLQDPSCGGKDGSFQVQAEGIVAPYQYALYKEVNGVFEKQENGTLIAGTLTFVFLSGGTYRVDVSKGGTCSESVTVNLQEKPLTLTPTNIHQPSCGGNDGSFSVQTTGINAPYQYVMSKLINGSYVPQENGTLIAGSPTFVFLPEGTYKVDITKGGTCSGSVTVSLEQAPLTMNLASLTPPSCGGSNGSFQVATTGIALPYPYKLLKEENGSYTQVQSGTLVAGTLTFVGLQEGNYQVVIDKGGTCSGSLTVYLYCEAIGKEGCSPGYWKNTPSAWVITNYSPTQSVESVFDVPDTYGLDNTTLLEALQGGGGNGTTGAAVILLRAATAATLNAAHRDVDFSKTLQYIITTTNAALASGNANTMKQLATSLDKYNNLACPLNAHSSVTGSRMDRLNVLQEGLAGLNLQAMPNPSAGAFNVMIQTKATDPVSVRIVDMQGRLIERRDHVPSGTTLRFGEHYTPGVYLLEVFQGNERKQLKLVKSGVGF